MAAIEGHCAECFKRLTGKRIHGQEGHTPVQFCSEEHKAMHAGAWASCTKAAIRSELLEDAERRIRTRELSKKRLDEWVAHETDAAIRQHLIDYRPDLIPYVGYGSVL